MPEHYRVAFIGTGGISRTHARYYVANRATEIVAACDIDPEKLKGFQEEFEVPAGYADYHQLLEQERPDIVSICTWHGTHAEICVAAAEAGAKGILAEKPMGRDLGEAKAMVEAAERHGARLAIHHQRRFDPTIVAVREAIGAGAIGCPVSMIFSTSGGLLNNGCHGIDLFVYLTGQPAWTSVFGQVQRTTNRYERGIPAEDKTLGVVRFEGGHELVLQVDMLEGEVVGTAERVLGPQGIIRYDRHGASLLSPGARDWQLLEERRPQPTPVEELIDWMEGGPEHRNSGRASLVAEEIMMAIYESARRRELVKPPFTRLSSPLLEMVADGTLAVDEPAYDIRSEAALQYEMQRQAATAD
ncbi:MAG: Gfo/Idh/MocA family oxidoreductase [Armatimonadetes bacterium]|nr:Gfo/Idh/MocA family oxidoreductase [Armatimonadota bacterium]